MTHPVSCNPAICWFTLYLTSIRVTAEMAPLNSLVSASLGSKALAHVCRPCEVAVYVGRKSLSNEMWPKWPLKKSENPKSETEVFLISQQMWCSMRDPPKGLEPESPYHDNPMSRRLSQSILLVKEVHLGGGTHFTHCTYPPHNPPKHTHPIHENAPDSVVTV